MKMKFTLPAMALAGILATSSLPALAAETAPAAPPAAPMHSGVKTDATKARPVHKKAAVKRHKTTKSKKLKRTARHTAKSTRAKSPAGTPVQH